MKMNCDFCLVKADEEEIKKVKETIIDKSPGFISFTALLREIFGVTVEATYICSKCMDAVMSHYTFREQVFKNLKLNESLDCSTQAKVKNFLRHIEEPAEVIIMDSVLSIVPNSQKSLFESQSHLISNFSPRVALERDDIEKLREKVRQDFLEAKEKIVDDFSGGIFGDDDYYSLQLSQAQSTSISTAPTLKRKATSITDSSNEVIPIKKFVKIEKEDDYERVQAEEENAKEASTEDQNFIPETNEPPVRRRSSRRRTNVNSSGLNNTHLTSQQDLVKKTKFVPFKKEQEIIRPIEQIHTNNNNSPFLNEFSGCLQKNTKLPEVRTLLSDLVEKSKQGNHYKCDICEKILNSRHAIYYHIEKRHILKELSYETLWVSEKIQQAKKKGSDKEWECMECSKVYTSQQALRAHLKLHYKTLSNSTKTEN